MAINSAAVWEVRTTGSDTNGGAFVSGTGTDYSQQATAQVAVADVVANGTTTLTSGTAAFTPAHIGNIIYLAGGSGSLVGTRRQVLLVTNATTITVDANVAAGTGITMSLGGCLASPGAAVGSITAGNTVWIKSGAYLISATANVPGGRIQPNVASFWIGYVATRGDVVLWGTMPTLRAGAGSMTIFTPANYDVSATNLEFDGNGFSATNAISATSQFRWRAFNCRAKNFTPTTPGGVFFSGNGTCVYCEASNNTVNAGGYTAAFYSGSCHGCYAHDNTGHGFMVGLQGVIHSECVSYGNTGDGFSSVQPLGAINCVSTNNGGNGFSIDAFGCLVISSISYGNAGYAFSTTTTRPDNVVANCAAGSNTAGTFHGTDIPARAITNLATLTADPFVSRTDHNFALNTTPGGGASCRATGVGSLVGGLTTSYPDMGVSQHADPTGFGVSKARIIGGL